MDNFSFKGVSSENFNIIVNSLPPITKPTMRVAETVIDGVDGSIIEELGYESYDKKVRITLTKDNTDEVISWLNGEGQLVLSNEPDRYYIAKVIEQIDYERLIKYEPTEVTFRVQPFKYEKDGEETTENVSEGNVIKLENAKIPSFKLYGITKQESYSGKNLLSNTATSKTENGVTWTINNDGSISVNGTATGYSSMVVGYAYVNSSMGKITISGLANSINIGWESVLLQAEDDTTLATISNSGRNDITFDLSSYSNAYKIRYQLKRINNIAVSGIIYPMIEKGSSSTTYEPYVGGKASPNPDYPQEIEVGIGKNLFDGEFELGTLATDTGATFPENTRIRTKNYQSVLPNTEYTISGEASATRWALFYDKDKNYLGYIQISGLTTKGTITTIDNAYYLKWYLVNYTNLETKEQLEKGSVATRYSPYKSISVRSNSTNIFNAKAIVNTAIEVNEDGSQIILPVNSSGNGNTSTATKLKMLAPNLKVGDVAYLNANVTNTNYGKFIFLYEMSMVWNYNTSKVITQEMLDSMVFLYGNNVNGGETEQVIISDFRIVKGTEDKPFEPYKESSLHYNLGDNFLADKDYIQDGVLNKNIRHLRLAVADMNRSEEYPGWGGLTQLYEDYPNKNSSLHQVCNFKCNILEGNTYGIGINTNGGGALWLPTGIWGLTQTQWKEQYPDLVIDIYYELATPEQIQLETTGELKAFEPNTIITNDLDSNMVVYFLDMPIAENKGNYYAKPIITIEGTGTIEFILNGNKIFRYTFPDGENKVVIDSEKQDAYLEGVLKNRNMSGEFPVFEIGKNIISWEGKITNLKIASKSRWL